MLSNCGLIFLHFPVYWVLSFPYFMQTTILGVLANHGPPSISGLQKSRAPQVPEVFGENQEKKG